MAPQWFFQILEMLASFIQIGDRYFATIKSPGGEDVLKDDGDQKIPFSSAVSAVAAARKRISEISMKKPKPKPKPGYVKPDVVAAWERERQAQYDKDRLAVLGVEVVSKRRFRDATEDRTGRPRYSAQR